MAATSECSDQSELLAEGNRGVEFDTERFDTCDYFHWIRDVSRCDLVHNFGGRVTQHPFGADVEDLNDPFCVVAILEKLALLKIALCSAAVLKGSCCPTFSTAFIYCMLAYFRSSSELLKNTLIRIENWRTEKPLRRSVWESIKNILVLVFARQ